MELLSLAIPAIRGYLDSKNQNSKSGVWQGVSKVFNALCMMLLIFGAIFGLFGLYEYYTSIYEPMWVKIYMAASCLVLAVVGGVFSLICKKIGVKCQQSTNQPTPTVVRSAEQYAQNALKTIETDGLNLIKQHPFAATLIGVSIGLISGMTTISKQK